MSKISTFPNSHYGVDNDKNKTEHHNWYANNPYWNRNFLQYAYNMKLAVSNGILTLLGFHTLINNGYKQFIGQINSILKEERSQLLAESNYSILDSNLTEGFIWISFKQSSCRNCLLMHLWNIFTYVQISDSDKVCSTFAI